MAPAGLACVRLIEAAGVLAEWKEDDRSRRKWQRPRRSAQESLRKLVEALPAHVTAEIMAASEKALGTAVCDVCEINDERRLPPGEYFMKRLGRAIANLLSWLFDKLEIPTLAGRGVFLASFPLFFCFPLRLRPGRSPC